MAALDRDAVAAVRHDRPGGRRSSTCRITCATRCGASSRPALEPRDAPGGLIVAGMGGSASAARSRAPRSATASRARWSCRATATTLPAWTGPDTLVLCSSYSGNTEETLAAYDARRRAGAPRARAPPPAARCAARARARRRARHPAARRLPAPRGGRLLARGRARGRRRSRAPRRRCATEIEAAAPLARSLAEEWGPGRRRGRRGQAARPRAPRDRAGDRRARGSPPRRPIAGSASSTRTPSSRRSPRELPEADHNEIVGWAAARELARFAAVFLEDPGAGERMQPRIELTAEIVGGQAAVVERVAPRGETPLRAARLARPARRPRVALPRGAARHRPVRRRADRPPQGGAGGALSVRLRSVVTAHASAVVAHAATIAARGPSALTSWPPSAAPAAEPAP